VKLIRFSEDFMDRKKFDKIHTIDFRTLNSIKTLIEFGIKIIIGTKSRYYSKEFEGKLIINKNLQNNIIVFQLFEGKHQGLMDQIFGKILEKILFEVVNDWRSRILVVQISESQNA
jgi:hypothetical protein